MQSSQHAEKYDHSDEERFGHRRSSHTRVKSKGETETAPKPAIMATSNVRYARYILFAVFVRQSSAVYFSAS